MHVAFDVGLHNKRLAIFPAPRGLLCVDTEAVRAPRAGPEQADDKPGVAANIVGISRRGSQWQLLCPPRRFWAWLPLAYVVVIASDYVGPPRTHGSKIAVGIVLGGPGVLLLMHMRGVRTPGLQAVVLAHLLVTLSFVADAQRFERETIAVTTLAALAGALVTHAAMALPSDMTSCVVAGCAGLYLGALVVLALLQWASAVDRMTLLMLQQLYVFMTLLLAGLTVRPAHV